MSEVKIMAQMPGITVFDPVVLDTFIRNHKMSLPNVLDNFLQDPDLGDKALSSGCMLLVYRIENWDYHIIITENEQHTVPSDWILFKHATFALNVTSGRVLVSDIWPILTWDESIYLNYESQLIDEKYATYNEFKEVVSVRVSNGIYCVTIIGFCDSENPDVGNRSCGYEFLLVRNESENFDVMSTGIMSNIENLDLDVIRLPE